MNSKQRCLAAIRGESVDRVPVFPLIMFLAADRLGVSYRDYATNGRVMASTAQTARPLAWTPLPLRVLSAFPLIWAARWSTQKIGHLTWQGLWLDPIPISLG
jgi:hypothetical protein